MTKPQSLLLIKLTIFFAALISFIPTALAHDPAQVFELYRGVNRNGTISVSLPGGKVDRIEVAFSSYYCGFKTKAEMKLGSASLGKESANCNGRVETIDIGWNVKYNTRFSVKFKNAPAYIEYIIVYYDADYPLTYSVRRTLSSYRGWYGFKLASGHIEDIALTWHDDLGYYADAYAYLYLDNRYIEDIDVPDYYATDKFSLDGDYSNGYFDINVVDDDAYLKTITVYYR